MPRWIVPLLIVVAAVSLVPFACIARARVTNSPVPRYHPIQDMDDQEKGKAQQPSKLFADGRAMRPPVEGTVARGHLNADDHLHLGLVGDAYATSFPAAIDVSMDTLQRGKDRFDIYCAPCHGLSGHGNGIVNKRALKLGSASWVSPATLHEEPALSREVGHLFNTITNGIRTMPAYKSQITVEDRWAIVSYIRALQRSGAGSQSAATVAGR